MKKDETDLKEKAANGAESLPFAQLKEANTIDEVINQLERLILESTETNDRVGYFASLYYNVTVKVREGIRNNEFEDGIRMEKLDVIFANRYLTAVKQWKNKSSLSGPWKISFEASKRSSILVLQHLLLGMNAHINFDLGIAAVQTTTNGDMSDIHTDFNSINSILGSLLFDVTNEINRVSPLISLFGLHSANDSFLIQFSIMNARDGAWSFAEDLKSKKGAEYDACILSRGETIKKLAISLVNQNGLIRFTIFIIHLFEWKKVRKIILVFYKYKKKFIHIS